MLISLLSVPIVILYGINLVFTFCCLSKLWNVCYKNEPGVKKLPNNSVVFLLIGLLCSFTEYLAFLFCIRFSFNPLNIYFNYTYRIQIWFTISQFFVLFSFSVFALKNIQLVFSSERLSQFLFAFLSVLCLLFAPIFIRFPVEIETKFLTFFNYTFIHYKVEINPSLNHYFLLVFLVLSCLLYVFMIIGVIHSFKVANRAFYVFFCMLLVYVTTIVMLRISKIEEISFLENTIICILSQIAKTVLLYVVYNGLLNSKVIMDKEEKI